MSEHDSLPRLDELRNHLRPPGPQARLAAITTAARRRQRRAAAVTGGVVAASVTAALLVTGGVASPDSLRTVTPAHSDKNGPSPSAVPRPTPPQIRPGTALAPSGPHSATTGRQPGAASAPVPSATTAPAPRVSTRPPAVQRTYSGSGSATVCGGIVSGAQSTAPRYCGSVAATPDGHSVDFDIQGTLDATSQPSQFTFNTAQEIDIAVYRNGKLVWRWSSGQTFADSRHSLPLQPGSSYDWTTRWNPTDANGKRLPAGDYTVVGSVLATELGGSNYWTGTFTL